MDRWILQSKTWRTSSGRMNFRSSRRKLSRQQEWRSSRGHEHIQGDHSSGSRRLSHPKSATGLEQRIVCRTWSFLRKGEAVCALACASQHTPLLPHSRSRLHPKFQCAEYDSRVCQQKGTQQIHQPRRSGLFWSAGILLLDVTFLVLDTAGCVTTKMIE